MAINQADFARRLKALQSLWLVNPTQNSAHLALCQDKAIFEHQETLQSPGGWAEIEDVSCLAIVAGSTSQDTLRYLKSVAIHLWLFGYELPGDPGSDCCRASRLSAQMADTEPRCCADTVLGITRTDVWVLTSAKKGELDPKACVGPACTGHSTSYTDNRFQSRASVPARPWSSILHSGAACPHVGMAILQLTAVLPPGAVLRPLAEACEKEGVQLRLLTREKGNDGSQQAEEIVAAFKATSDKPVMGTLTKVAHLLVGGRGQQTSSEQQNVLGGAQRAIGHECAQAPLELDQGTQPLEVTVPCTGAAGGQAGQQASDRTALPAGRAGHQ